MRSGRRRAGPGRAGKVRGQVLDQGLHARRLGAAGRGHDVQRAKPARKAGTGASALFTREDFRRGDKVAVENKYPQTMLGTIVRINDRRVTVDTAADTAGARASR